MRLLLSVLLLAFFVTGCTKTPQVAKKSPFEKLFLWKAVKNENTLYLFGTMHSTHPVFQHIPPKLAKHIAKSDALYTEIKMDMIEQLKMMRLMMRSDGKRLSAVLPWPLYEEIERYINMHNPALSLKQLDRLKTWGVLALLVNLVETSKYPDNKPFDDRIYTFASALGKEVGGIETIEEQASYFDRFSENEQITMLKETFELMKNEPNIYAQMRQAYLSGDENKVQKFIDKMMVASVKSPKLSEKFMRIFMYERNRKMANRIDALIAKNPRKTCMFAFGVMHFLGSKSVLGYLKQKGYKVRKLP